jgi:hypothetical protein
MGMRTRTRANGRQFDLFYAIARLSREPIHNESLPPMVWRTNWRKDEGLAQSH